MNNNKLNKKDQNLIVNHIYQPIKGNYLAQDLMNKSQNIETININIKQN